METHGPPPVAACLPRLSLLPLLILRAKLGRAVVYFDDFSRIGRRIPSATVVRAYELLTGLTIRRLPRHDDSPDYPRLTVLAMRKVLDCCSAVELMLKASRWVSLLADLIGEEPALAYFLRQLSWLRIWPLVSAAVVCRGALGASASLVFAWDADWPASWQAPLERALGRGFSLFPWPWWYRTAISLSRGSYGFVPRALARLLRHGIARRRAAAADTTLLTEFIDPSRMGGTPVDADYWIDGCRLKTTDVVFFLAPEQGRHLERNGIDVQRAVAGLTARYRIMEVTGFPYTMDSAREVLGAAFKAVARPLFLSDIFFLAWRDFATYLPLFDRCKARSFLHTPFPNGNAGPRLDSAIVTALCRRFGTRSVGYQNRCVYDKHFEWCFDCYDLLLAWGPAWHGFLGEEGARFIREIKDVGCLNNDGALPSKKKDGLTVSIFTFELYGNHYPKTYTAEMIEACVALAKAHPECRFQVKTKDPSMVDILLADPRLRSLCDGVSKNFRFLRIARFGAAPVVAESDIVIAQAFSTVGSDALLLGKRVLFYSKLGDSGQPFAGLPNLVARDSEELSRLFETALRDHRDYARSNAAALAALDPFRDGNARKRILDSLA